MQAKALPYLLLLPATLFLLVFFVYPFIQIAILAVTRDGSFSLQPLTTMATHWKFSSALGWTPASLSALAFRSMMYRNGVSPQWWLC